MSRECHGAITYADLLNAGRLGLFQAASRFDESRDVPFRAFAHARVRGAMLDYVRATCFPRRSREAPGHLATREASALQRRFARNHALSASIPISIPIYPTLEDDGDFAPASSNDTESGSVTAIRSAQSFAAELSSALANQRNRGDDNPEAQVSRAEALQQIRATIEGFPTNERLILIRHYFQNDEFRSIARDLRVDPSWVTRIHARALRRLAKRLRL